MSVSQDLSMLIAQAEFRALSPDVVEVAKTVILDGLSVTLAGSVEPPARIVAEYVRDTQVIAQAKAVGLTLLWSGIGSAIIFLIVKMMVGARVSPDEEQAGLDVSLHGERGYAYEH